MKPIKLLILVPLLVVLVMFSAFGAFSTPQVHAASTVSQTHAHTLAPVKERSVRPLIYQTQCTSVTVELVGYKGAHAICYYGSGTAYPHYYTMSFYAGNWSGYFYVNSSPYPYDFCDWQAFGVNSIVTTLYLSPSREPWCH